MRLKLLRYSTSKESTLGLFYIDNEFECYTLEDTYRKKKIVKETRIGSGIYTIELRKEGGLNSKYKKKFPDIHKGMLWLRNVPNFQYVYIHIGNESKHSAGCILVGDGVNNNINKSGFINSSTTAYKRVYSKIVKAIEKNESVIIEIIDYA